MGEKAEYKSAVRSRKLIRRAYMEMLEEKPLDKITVTDIVRRADINRGTFYAHYPDVRGVTEEIENEIIDEMLAVLSDFRFAQFFDNPAPLLLEISRFFERDVAFFRVLVSSDHADVFLEKLQTLFVEHMLTDTDIPPEARGSKTVQLRVTYFAGGAVNLYKEWFKGRLDCSLNDIAMEVSRLLHMQTGDLY